MGTTMTRLEVPGLSKSADIAVVTNHLREVDGVRQLTTQVRTDGSARISILSGTTLHDEDLRGAVKAGGFQVAGVEVVDNALAHSMAEQAPARQAAHSSLV
jgi:hypothetical protein